MLFLSTIIQAISVHRTLSWRPEMYKSIGKPGIWLLNRCLQFHFLYDEVIRIIAALLLNDHLSLLTIWWHTSAPSFWLHLTLVSALEDCIRSKIWMVQNKPKHNDKTKALEKKKLIIPHHSAWMPKALCHLSEIQDSSLLLTWPLTDKLQLFVCILRPM